MLRFLHYPETVLLCPWKSFQEISLRIRFIWGEGAINRMNLTVYP